MNNVITQAQVARFAAIRNAKAKKAAATAAPKKLTQAQVARFAAIRKAKKAA